MRIKKSIYETNICLYLLMNPNKTEWYRLANSKIVLFSLSLALEHWRSGLPWDSLKVWDRATCVLTSIYSLSLTHWEKYYTSIEASEEDTR